MSCLTEIPASLYIFFWSCAYFWASSLFLNSADVMYLEYSGLFANRVFLLLLDCVMRVKRYLDLLPHSFIEVAEEGLHKSLVPQIFLYESDRIRTEEEAISRYFLAHQDRHLDGQTEEDTVEVGLTSEVRLGVVSFEPFP